MIQKLLRPEVQNMIAYKPTGNNSRMVLLDGNESPYNLPPEIREEIAGRISEMTLNRYPDSTYDILRQKITDGFKVEIGSEQVMPANGSDEVIQFMVQAFIQPGDRVLAMSPTFSMYRVFTQLAGGVYKELPFEKDGSVDQDLFLETVREYRPKMIFLCSPNNPTGIRISTTFLREILAIFRGILVVDEAYAEFSKISAAGLLRDFSSLVITRTFSKAFGLAGIRLGYLAGSRDMVTEISRVIRPYHINSITGMIGEIILDNYSLIEERIDKIISERERMKEYLSGYSGWRVFPSEANFLYLTGPDVPVLANVLAEAGIKVREFPQAVRITIGTPAENEQVCQVVEGFRQEDVKYGA